MRLESLRGNWSRVRVGSRKINRTFLKEKDSAVSCSPSACARADRQDIKLRYYDLLVQLALQDDIYLEACQAYQEVWDTEEVKADEAREVDVSLFLRLLEN
jgi:26S proteasome regulatory subunit N5